jgi:hypothetical protein
MRLSFELVLMEVLVEALHHKKGSSELDSLWVSWKFSSDLYLLSIVSGPMVHLV